MKLRYGEDSNAFRIRVLGEFPMADDDTIIPFHLAEAAMRRDIEPDTTQRPIWAVDPARFGSDRTAFCRRVGGVITDITSWQGLDTMQTVGRVKAEYDAQPFSVRPSLILVDSIGIGAGVVDRLLPFRALRGPNVAATARVVTFCERAHAALHHLSSSAALPPVSVESSSPRP